MTELIPEGYLGADTRLRSGPAPELVAAGYALETADAPMLHEGLGFADLAHVLALDEAGVIPADAARTLLTALLEVIETPAAQFPYNPLYGDAYNSRERELERNLGDTAGWLHTGRTRREAGRIAFRLALRDRTLELQDAVVTFVRDVLARVAEHERTFWNDTTYLQPAQASTFGHYLLTFAEEGIRHLERLDAVAAWADRSPAGVGAVGGTRIPLDRQTLADLLGFAAVGEHSRDVMWSIDGLVDAVVAAAQVGSTLDRLAEDLEIFTSPQFNYVELDASTCRASVLLPQKRNPYGLSVIRGGANVLIGRAAGLMATQRTPSARTDNWLYSYGETIGSLELAHRLVALAAILVRTMDINRAILEASAGSHFTTAADLADELVLQARLDYRTAYRIVGACATAAYEAGRTRFNETDLETIAAAAEHRGASVDLERLVEAADPVRSVETRDSVGGSAPTSVSARRRHLSAQLDRIHRRLVKRRDHYRSSEDAMVSLAQARLDQEAPDQPATRTEAER